jgi:alpha-tubulin suppressor-like RCC1 family protein
VPGLLCACGSKGGGAALPPPAPALACGAESSAFALRCGCCLFSWGWNEHGNLGVGDAAGRLRPARDSRSRWHSG